MARIGESSSAEHDFTPKRGRSEAFSHSQFIDLSEGDDYDERRPTKKSLSQKIFVPALEQNGVDWMDPTDRDNVTPLSIETYVLDQQGSYHRVSPARLRDILENEWPKKRW